MNRVTLFSTPLYFGSGGPVGGEGFRRQVRKLEDEAGKQGLIPQPLTPTRITPFDDDYSDDGRPVDSPIVVVVPPPPVPPPPPLPPLL